MNEHEKTRSCNKQVLQVYHGTFISLVFSVYGSMERECNTFYSRLSQLLSDKRNLSKSIAMNWIRTKVYFALLKSGLLCLRGSRTVCRNVSQFERDTDVSHEHGKIWITKLRYFGTFGWNINVTFELLLCNLFIPFIVNIRPI